MTTWYEGDTVELHVYLTDESGQPRADASEVEVRITGPTGVQLFDLKLTTGGVTNLGSGNYSARFDMGVAGSYTVTVLATSSTNEHKAELSVIYANSLE